MNVATPSTSNCDSSEAIRDIAEYHTPANVNLTDETKLSDREKTKVLKTQPKVKSQKSLVNIFKEAVETNSENIIGLLLDQGLNVNAALVISINSGNENALKIVLDRGADVDEGLYFAVKANKPNVISLLLARGANINTEKRNGNTPLHAAVIQKCDIHFVKFLIDNGADVNARAKNNKTALDLVQNCLTGKNDLVTTERLENVLVLLKRHTLSDNIFECLQGMPDGLSGYSYQIKLLTLYAIINTKLAISKGCQYELGTEVKDYLPFDDIYLRKSHEDITKYEFVQVKQTKKPECNKIEQSNFFISLKTEKNVKESLKGNDSVIKMFIKFNEITKNLDSKVSADFIYCTNTTFNNSSGNCFVSEDYIKDELLCSIGRQIWKIQHSQYINVEIKFVLLNVIVISQYFKTMNEDIQSELIAQINRMKNSKIEELEKNYSLQEKWNVTHISKEGLKGVSNYLKIINILKLNIKSASDEKTIKDNLPEECYIHNYAGDVALLRKKALAKLKEVYHSLKNDEELFLNFSKSGDDVIQNQIDHFINHFYVLTNCPTSDEIDVIITKEIQEEFNSPNSRLFADHCLQFFSKWVSNFKNERGNMFTDVDGKRLFHDLKAQILIGYSKSYVEHLKMYNISFVENTGDDQIFAALIKNEKCKILHVVTNNPQLHALKILQVLQSEHNNCDLDNVLWTTLERIIKSNKTTQYFFSALSFDASKNVLIVEFPNISNEYGNLYEIINTLMEIVTKNEQKKIILIAPNDDKLILELKRLVKENYSFESTISFKDLTSESKEIIMHKSVKFQNNSSTHKKYLKVKDFLEEATAIQVIDEDILSMIVTEKSSITISESENYSNVLEEYYIPRRIRHQFINKSDLANIFNCLMFLTGATKAELISIIGCDYFVKTFEKDKQYCFGYIVMPDEDHNGINKTEEEIFSCICDQSLKLLPIIWCELKDECFVWKRVKIWKAAQMENLIESVVDIGNLDHFSFPPEDVEDKVVILANNPGEGKTTMLSQLRESLKKKSPQTWIIQINLKNYTDNTQPVSLNYINFNEIDTVKAAESLALMVTEAKNDTTSKLERRFMEAILNGCGEIKMILLFDGFDEISPSYKEKTCTLLKALSGSNVKQIWVTTRIHLKNYLEAHLQVTAYKLTTLTDKEQSIFLNGFWKWNFKNYKLVQDNVTDDTIITGIVNQLKLCYENCNKYIEDSDDFKSVIEYDHTNLVDLQKCIDSKINMGFYGKMLLQTWNDALSDGGDFTSVPLNLEMLARNIFDSQWIISKTAKINIFDMYTQFVDSKLSIFEHNKSTTLSNNEVMKDQAELASVIYREMHRAVAVKTIFETTSSLPDINVCSKYKNLNEKLTRMGLMKLYGNRVEFLHRSYAEYFCGEYVAMYLDNHIVQTELLMKILDNDDYFLTRHFLDGFLSRSPLLRTINQDKEVDINYSFESVLIPSIKEEIINQKNNRELTILHYAAREGHAQIYKFVISELHQATIYKYNELFNVIMNCGNTQLKVEKKLYIETNEQFRKEDIVLKRRLAFSTILKNVNIQVIVLTFLCEHKNINDLPAFNLIEEIRKIIDSEKEHPDKFINLITKCEKKKCATLHITIWDYQNDISELIIYIAKEYLVETKREQENRYRMHEEAQNYIENNCNKILTICEKLSIIMSEITCKCKNKIYISMHKTVTLLQSEIFSAILKAIEEYRDIKKCVLIHCDHYQYEYTPLHFAAVNGHIELCKLILITANEYPNMMRDLLMGRADYQQTVLHLAANRGHDEVCDTILKNARKFPAIMNNLLTAYDLHDETALHLAAKRNCTKVCSLIMESATEYPDIIEVLILKYNQLERTALHIAAEKGYSNVCVLILEIVKQYPDIMKKLAINCDRHKHTLLDRSARYGQTEAFDIIIKTINQCFPELLMNVIIKHDLNERTCIDIAASYGHSEFCDVVLKTLKEHQDIIIEIITKVNSNNHNLLYLAANAGHDKVCEVLLQAIRELPKVMKNVLTKQDRFKKTPLHVAAKNGFEKVCEIIMNNAKKYPHILKNILTICDSDRHSPLDLAVWYGHIEASNKIMKTVKSYPDIIKLFITKCNDIKFTILHLAAWNKDSTICSFIINNINECPENMRNLFLKCVLVPSTPLHLAAGAGHTDVCEVLIHAVKEYPDVIVNFVTKCDEFNQNALHIASKRKRGQTCNAILKTVKEYYNITNDLLTKCDDFGRTPLHIAAQRGYREVSEILIENAKDHPDIFKNLLWKCDHNNKTAADLAESNGHDDIYNIIIKCTAHENDSLIPDCHFEQSALVWSDNSKLCNNIIQYAGEYKDIIEHLIENCEWNKSTPLHLAAQKGLKDVCEIIIMSVHDNPEVMKYLILKCDYKKQTALHTATAYGHREVCELIINSAKEFPKTIMELISKRNQDNLTILHLAAQNGLSEVCNMIIENIIKNENSMMTDLLLKRDLNRRTPFHLASLYGKMEVCEIFIQTATEYGLLNDLITSIDINNQTALHLAASRSHTLICNFIMGSVKENSNTLESFIMKYDNNGQNILHLIARNGLTEFCNTLLDSVKECSHNFVKNILTKGDVNKFTCLDIAAMYGHDKVCELIVITAKNYPVILKNFITKCNGEPNVRSPLHLAALYGHSKVCTVIIKHVCEYDYISKYLIVQSDKNDRTVLHLAAENGLNEVCRGILRIAKKYSDDIMKELILKCDVNKRSALHLSAWKGHSNVSDILLKTANEYNDVFFELITMCDINKRTPLHRAAANGHSEVCNVILKAAEAYPDIVPSLITKCDKYKQTALHLAAQNGLSDICDDIMKKAKKYFLIPYILIRDTYDESALDLAAWGGYDDVCEILLSSIKNENKLLRDLLLDGNRTPIHFAAYNFHWKIIDTILKADSSILTDILTKTDEHNNTALHLAAMNGDCTVLEVIMRIAKEYNVIRVLIQKCDFANRTALLVAAKRGYSEFCDVLLKTVECCPDIIKFLLTKADWNRHTPLQIAARNGYAEACEVILKYAVKYPEVYAEIIIKEDKYKRNVIALAKDKGHDSVCDLIWQNANDNKDIIISSSFGSKYKINL